MKVGLFRDSAFVQVSYEGLATVPISRALYEKRGYWPPFDDLPTKEEYEAEDAKPKTPARP